MSMFCGLPVIVATLPMFEAVATASRYGSGLGPCAARSGESERNHDQADDVVDEKRRKYAGDEDDGRQQVVRAEARRQCAP